MLNKAIKAIKKLDNFIITSHVNLEGDSLGSQLAVARLLKELGKKFVVYDNDRVPERYLFLPAAKIVKTAPFQLKIRPQAAIVLDCPNLERTGNAKNAVLQAGTIINIDHHVSNERFGNINWVEKGASSAGEMVYKLYKKIGVPIDRETALYIYIAILTDTGSFNYSNTSSITHEIVGELLRSGLEPNLISRNIYENKKIGELRLLGRVLSGIKVASGGKIAYAAITKKMFKETGTGPMDCENFVNFARAIRGVEIAVAIREDVNKKNTFNINLRSTGKANVNKIASAFGGGGHKNASGCTLHGSFSKVKNRILSRAKDEIR